MLVSAIRQMIAEGLSDDEIAEQIAMADADRAEHEAAYGPADIEHDGPAHLHDDGHYSRNDAGEFSWM